MVAEAEADVDDVLKAADNALAQAAEAKRREMLAAEQVREDTNAEGDRMAASHLAMMDKLTNHGHELDAVHAFQVREVSRTLQKAAVI